MRETVLTIDESNVLTPVQLSEELVTLCYDKMNENPWVQLDFLDCVDAIPGVIEDSTRNFLAIRKYLTSRYGSTIPADLLAIAESSVLMQGRRDRGMELITGYWKRWIFQYLENRLKGTGRVGMGNAELSYFFNTSEEHPSTQTLSRLRIPVTIWASDKSRVMYDKTVDICHIYNGMWYVTVTDKKDDVKGKDSFIV